MNRLKWLVSAFALCASPALAQSQSMMSTSTAVKNVRPYKELQAYGSCLAKTQRKAALTLMATVPGSREEQKFLKQFVYGEQVTCLFGGTQMTLPDMFARGAVAEGLLRTGGVPAELRLPAPAAGEARDLHGVARCYTVDHRDEVENLLHTDPGSPEEVKAVAGLWDGFRACMPGAKVRLNAPWIRFLLAEALLRVQPKTVP